MKLLVLKREHRTISTNTCIVVKVVTGDNLMLQQRILRGERPTDNHTLLAGVDVARREDLESLTLVLESLHLGGEPNRA